ncbi:hypothetical protein OPT61_g3300 [Boeremia exigua]|uniref:Uncharacterized protein n=1 Tax=Boeremia exigua TaxID=749465 RepID=A0ACC2II92_9PLEO|nr:hypothetical protein OPT61_g3300 [Boeremia exigua]
MENHPGDQQYPTLRAIWCMESSRKRICHSCHLSFDPGAILRTCRIDAPDTPLDNESSTSTYIVSGRRISLIHRHFGCLLTCGVKYIPISHVWCKQVSILQNQGASEVDESSEDALEARRRICTEVIDVYEGIARSVDGYFETWHDYVSVPQWEPELKIHILLKIPEIYNRASFTVVYLHDVEPVAVDRIRNPEATPTPFRLNALTHVCNSHWFRRVWTAMEYIRSPRVRVMVKGYQLYDDGDDLYSHGMQQLWHEEGMRVGDIFELESLAGLNHNLLPWQVGGLTTLRSNGERDLGLAYERLALRGCTNPMDFYYALLGLVGFEEHLASDLRGAHWQIMRRCLINQDYSPILMVPVREHMMSRFFYGFSDISTWGLGPIETNATFRLSLKGTRALFQAQLVGKIKVLETSLYIPYEKDPVPIFTQPARIVLSTVHADIEKFVIMLGMRIFGVNPYAILRRLKRLDRYEALQETLILLHNGNAQWTNDVALQMIEDLGFGSVDIVLDQRPEDGLETPSYWRQPQVEFSPRWTPMSDFMMNGTSVHLDEDSAYIIMDCAGCNEPIMTRAAIYRPHAEVHQAIGFRIPGLRYEKSLPDGIGILVIAGQIVGRYVYCCPCCKNPPIQEIEVEIPDVPMPAPNPTKYGEVKSYPYQDTFGQSDIGRLRLDRHARSG